MKKKNGRALDGRVTASVAEPDSTPATDAKNNLVRDAAEGLGNDGGRRRAGASKVTLERAPQLEREARELLESPEFFTFLRQALRRERLVGEERNALVLYVVAISALLDRPLTAIVKGSSSAGKNHLASRVLRLVPEEAVREIGSSSKTAWNYSGDDFRHSVVYLPERDHDPGVVHSERLSISEGRLIRTVTVAENGVRVAKTFVTEGPIASISTTTRNRIEVDDETRHISLWVDESREQTRRVNEGYVSPELRLSDGELAVWRQAYTLIKARADVPVTLPDWFTIIAESVFDGSVTSRRYFPAFIEACKTIALVRSFKKQSGARRPHKIKVAFADLAIAAVLFEDVFVESLHRDDDKNMKTRMAVQEISDKKGGAPVTAEELAEHMSISSDRAYRSIRAAVDAGAITRANVPEKGT
jgi:hypothetical protein